MAGVHQQKGVRQDSGETSRTLYLRAGLLDSPFREEIKPDDHRLYAWAREVHAGQDDWSQEAHCAGWWSALSLWPRKGHRSRKETTAHLLGHWANEGYTRSEMEHALGYGERGLAHFVGAAEKLHTRLTITRVSTDGFRSLGEFRLPRIVTEGDPSFEAFYFDDISHRALTPEEQKDREEYWAEMDDATRRLRESGWDHSTRADRFSYGMEKNQDRIDAKRVAGALGRCEVCGVETEQRDATGVFLCHSLACRNEFFPGD